MLQDRSFYFSTLEWEGKLNSRKYELKYKLSDNY